MKKSFFHLRPAYVIKTCVYSVYAILLICTVSSFLPSVGYRGAAPDLLLFAVIALSYFESERVAAIFGMIAGFALEAVGSVGFCILPLFYMLCGCVCSLLFTRVLQRNFGSYMLYGALLMLLRVGISVIYTQFSAPDYSIDLLFRNSLADEYVLSVACAPVLFLLTSVISKRLDTSRDQGEVLM